jgi:glucan phosphoethanolaminetransferase (alkaline phosphatase superfamily)
MSPRRKLLLLPFWLAVLLAVLGSVITFYPGAQCGWFLTVAGLALPCVLIPRVLYRICATVLLVCSLIAAYNGYCAGLEYQHWLSVHFPSQ